MPSEYYSFKKGDWVFIMLNTNEIASYANIAGTPKENEWNRMQEQIKQIKGKYAYEERRNKRKANAMARSTIKEM